MSSNTVSKINIKLGAQTADLEAGFQRASVTTHRFASRLSNFTQQAGAAAGAIGRMVTMFAALAGVGSLLSGLSGAMKLAAQAETAAVSFEVLTGSAEKAQQVLGGLQKFAANTPFQMGDLTGAATKLLAFGTSAENVVPTLKMLGDLSAGLQIPIGELAELYGKAQVQGRLFMEDINQLTGRGIPIIQEFAKQFGVTEEQVRAMASAGKIGFADLQQAFIALTSEGSKFGGMAEKQSQTLEGRWSTLIDGVKKLGQTFGEILAPYAKQALEAIFPLLDDLGAGLETFGPMIAAFAAEWVKRFEQIILSMRMGVQFLTAVGKAINRAFGPETLALLGKVVGQITTLVHKMLMLPTELVRKLFGGYVGDAEKAVDKTDDLKIKVEELDTSFKSFAAIGDQTRTALQELSKSGEQLEKSLRTPFERATDAITEYMQMLNAGAISMETYQRAVAKAQGQLLEAHKAKEMFERPTSPHVGAVTRRSTAGFSAANEAAHGNAQLVRLQEQQRQLIAETNRLLQSLNTEVRNNRLVINTVSLP